MVGPFRMALRAQSVTALAAYLKGTRGAALAKMFARDFRAMRPGVRERLVTELPAAVLLGVRQGLEVLGLEKIPAGSVTDRYLAAALEDVDRIALERLGEASALAGRIALDERTEFDLITAKANTALMGADWTARWATNRAISAGTSKVAAEHGARLVWVPERDACLHCLAYAGWVVEPGQPFPPGLTYADKPLKPYGDLLYPPLHPNCRCQVDVTYLPVGRTDGGMVREAERTVARGLSNYASEPAQLRAADKMLKSPTLLPKSVRERARRNITAGKFKDRPKEPGPLIVPSKEPAPKSPRRELADIARQEGSTITTLVGGQSNTTELVTTTDGRQAVRKTIRPGMDADDNVFLLDGEELASLLADAVRAPVAPVYRKSPGEVWVRMLPGKVPDPKEIADLLASREGILIGLVDALSGYGDRRSGLRIADGKLSAFDSGGAWIDVELEGAGARPRLTEVGAPISNIIGMDDRLKSVDLSLAELEAIRTRVAKLRRAFAKRGRSEWLDYALSVLDQLISLKR